MIFKRYNFVDNHCDPYIAGAVLPIDQCMRISKEAQTTDGQFHLSYASSQKKQLKFHAKVQHSNT